MNVLVLGGNRFIGAELVARLLAEGHQVAVFALDPPSPELRELIHFTMVNRNDLSALKSHLNNKQFDAVFDNIAFLPGQVEGLLEALGERCGRYVLTSSADIYPGSAQQWREKDGPLEPSSIKDAPKSEHYERNKRGCEKVLRSSGVPFAIVRPAMVTGARDPVPARPNHWASSGASRSLHLPSRVLDGGPILLPMNDRRTFQLAWVQDVARALVIAGTHPETENETLNVAGDELWSHERLVYALAAAGGRQIQIVRVSDTDLLLGGLGGYEPPWGRGGRRRSLYSNERLKELGWIPTPPQVWLPQLLDAVRDPDRRPFYSYRSREVALAHRLMRHSVSLSPSAELAALADPPQVPCQTLLPNDTHLDSVYCRSFDGRKISSIAIGTHRGDANTITDEYYTEALRVGLAGGLNLIDTAINYRAMRSERVVGRVVRERLAEGIARESMFVVTKGGFVPHDADDPRSASIWRNEELVQRGLLEADDAAERHSIRASWISESLRRSLANLGLDKVDAYLLHNPELDLPRLGAHFWPELTRTFALLEEAVDTGRIGCYGLALWNTINALPGDPMHLSIERALRCAYTASGGGSHHLRIIELPLNVSNVNALRKQNQMLHGDMATALRVAEHYGLFVLTSASVARGGQLDDRVRARLPSEPMLDSDLVRALQFTRSAPGVGSALVGMRRVEYVRDALMLAARPPLHSTEVLRLVALA